MMAHRWSGLCRLAARFWLLTLFLPPPALRAQSQPASQEPEPTPEPEPEPQEPAPPFRLDRALHAPEWLSFSITQRLRFEYVHDDFRQAATGDTRAFSMRTLVPLELHFAPVSLGAEFEDSRVYANPAALLNTTFVDAVDILQAYVKVGGAGVFAEEDSASLTVGRFTMDLGSRRLVARNNFRNTINAFTGVDLQWTSPTRHELRLFAAMPVIRLPSDAAALADNDIELDHEDTDAIFYGAFYRSPHLRHEVEIEAYALAIQERDNPDAPSSNRQMVTPGVRVRRAPAVGELDFELEVMAQAGSSHASKSATDTTKLHQSSASIHAALGYRFEAPGSPRVVLLYDFASGDRDPNDGRNGRFDPLYGARRFELNPTGFWGAFARSNIDAPGLRIEISPHRRVDAFAAYRPYWLASATDAWTTAGWRDPTGSSGTFVGHHLEARVRVHVLPKNLELEVGGATLLLGQFGTAFLGSNWRPAYFYTQLTWSI